MGSLVLKAAKEASVPAGMSLSVDREVFSKIITEKLKSMPNVTIVNRVVESLDDVPRPAVIATGPLTHDPLAESLREHFGEEFLYFFDAIAPIIDADTINQEIAWKGDRFEKGNADYYNCGMTRDQYYQFAEEILKARKVVPKDFEITPYFEGCMPIETMFERGIETPRFGPMSYKGLKNSRTGERYYAVVQLRQDNKEGTAFNMVGFQTKMAYGEQTRIFRMIPGLEEAEFLKLGSIHRNLYIRSPRRLTKILSSPKDPNLFFAGQITGVEGYFESTCIGLLVAHMMADQLQGRTPSLPPRASAFGSLLNGITEDNETFQPTNINFGLFPRPDEARSGRKGRREKKALQLDIAKEEFKTWLEEKGIELPQQFNFPIPTPEIPQKLLLS